MLDIKSLNYIIRENNIRIDILGVTPAIYYKDKEEQYLNFIKKFNIPIKYLLTHAKFKYNPHLILPNCNTIIVIGINYYQNYVNYDYKNYENLGKVSRYAWGRDYHKVLNKKLKSIVNILKKLFPKEKFYYGVDFTKLDERYYALKAGIGILGKHGLIINKDFGSWIFLGVILTTLKIKDAKIHPDKFCFSKCRKCIEACPTNAIISPFILDINKCISYHTIENRNNEIPTEVKKKMGNWIFGCDICQEVCPYNKNSKITKELDFLNHRTGPFLNVYDIIKINSNEDYLNLFAGTPLMRIKREGLIRNAKILLENNYFQKYKKM